MDAMFFIILLGLATVLISQAVWEHDDGRQQGLSDACDIVFGSEIDISSLGYTEESRIMHLYDIAAVSIALGDGKAARVLGDSMQSIYPWENSFGMVLTYLGSEVSIGIIHDDWSSSTVRSYEVEYGGTLTVTVYLYG